MILSNPARAGFCTTFFLPPPPDISLGIYPAPFIDMAMEAIKPFFKPLT